MPGQDLNGCQLENSEYFWYDAPNSTVIRIHCHIYYCRPSPRLKKWLLARLLDLYLSKNRHPTNDLKNIASHTSNTFCNYVMTADYRCSLTDEKSLKIMKSDPSTFWPMPSGLSRLVNVCHLLSCLVELNLGAIALRDLPASSNPLRVSIFNWVASLSF